MRLTNILSLSGLATGLQLQREKRQEFPSDERNPVIGPFGRLSVRNTVPCAWAGWCDWTPCQATCGDDAVQSRTRECVCDNQIDPSSRGCLGDDHEINACGDRECPEAELKDCWTDWSEWGECCGDCGTGSRERSRSCTCGPLGCAQCPGDNIHSEPCTESKCSVGDWGLWSECTVTCGNGSRQRGRDCVCPNGLDPEECGGCGDENLEEDEPCNEGPCTPEWEAWSPCTSSCGADGTRTRAKPCDNPEKSSETPVERAECDAADCLPCPKAEPEECDCSVPKCDRAPNCVDNCPEPKEQDKCKWSPWSNFCPCSATCDDGVQERKRKCYCGKDYEEEATILPQPGCEGPSVNEESCNEAPCDPTEGCESDPERICTHGTWSDYGPCEADCNKPGQMFRERDCDCPVGIPSDHPECGCDTSSDCKSCMGPCPNPPEWNEWTPCDCETEPPVKTRTRDCDEDTCDSDTPLTETVDCDKDECALPTPKTCLGDWENWGVCDAVCGPGTRKRDRPCFCGQPGCPGCEGTTEEEECEGDSSLMCIPGLWSEYGPCDATCGEPGQMFRNRDCECPEGITEDHPDCGCDSSDCKTCVGECSCPGEWSDWGPCDGPCGSGYRERTRADPCSTDIDGNPAPLEPETESCGEIQTCEVSEWSEFGPCEAECDQYGQQYRNRECTCPEDVDSEDEECGCGPTQECITCKGPACECFDDWSEWTECDGPCGSGSRQRSRSDPCNPETEPEIEMEECKEILCTNTEWGEWTECEAPLGEYGQKFRHRECSCPPGGDAENPDCGCGPNEECETCKGEPLCNWSPWAGDKAPCSTTCGGGIVPKSRTCNQKPTPKDNLMPDDETTELLGMPEATCPSQEHIDEGCPGAFKENTPCSVDACPPKCEHGPWCEWSGCSATCGGGKDFRTRECECPEGVEKSTCENSGQCEGEPIEENDCNTDVTCPPQCEWSPDWEEWRPCTVTCGTGTQSRQKKCECKDSDECDGCEGIPPTEFQDCATEMCSCWGDWNPWSGCPDNCGTSVKERNRECLCGEPGDGPNEQGPGCEDEDLEQAPCEGKACMWDCWGEWGSCMGGINSTVEGPPCGLSMRERTHECDCPDGADETECGCDGDTTEQEQCDLGSCDACYTKWSPWTACDPCGGISTRDRQCFCDEEYCQFETTQMQDCPGKKCKPAPWSVWSPCSATCGERATMTKTRDCNCPPGVDENICGCGELSKTKKCPNIPDECPPECDIGEWCNWSECDSDCGPGTQARVRTCDCQAGVECPEVTEEQRECPEEDQSPCEKAETCGFSDWCNWSTCDGPSCASDSKQVRSRYCDCDEATENDCLGETLEDRPCEQDGPCEPVTGKPEREELRRACRGDHCRPLSHELDIN